MKKIFKLLTVAFVCIALVGCSCVKKTAKGAVEDFLNQYRNLSSNVISDMDEVIKNENLSDEQKEVYRDVLKKQYQDLKYEITSEEYDGDKAKVEAKITVYDLYKVQKEASEYMVAHSDEFNNDEGNYDNSLFMDYKLNAMQKATDTVEYTISFDVTKDDNGNYKVTDLSQASLEKIHGIYDYDTNE